MLKTHFKRCFCNQHAKDIGNTYTFFAKRANYKSPLFLTAVFARYDLQTLVTFSITSRTT